MSFYFVPEGVSKFTFGTPSFDMIEFICFRGPRKVPESASKHKPHFVGLFYNIFKYPSDEYSSVKAIKHLRKKDIILSG